ncbi:helix-turn-helix domain-containing protein (plasmid) [Methylobacterium oryzae CBMB20]
MSDQPFRLTPSLCRAGRAFLSWRQADLAQASGVPEPTINAFEGKPETGRMMAANSRLLIMAFEMAGLEFIPENGGGAGIRFRERKGQA